jgi:hypothetical protein
LAQVKIHGTLSEDKMYKSCTKLRSTATSSREYELKLKPVDGTLEARTPEVRQHEGHRCVLLTIRMSRLRPVAEPAVEAHEDCVIPPHRILLKLVIVNDEVPSGTAKHVIISVGLSHLEKEFHLRISTTFS